MGGYLEKGTARPGADCQVFDEKLKGGGNPPRNNSQRSGDIGKGGAPRTRQRKPTRKEPKKERNGAKHLRPGIQALMPAHEQKEGR